MLANPHPDVRDPRNPVPVGRYDGAFNAMAVSESLAYVNEWGLGLHVLDASDPGNQKRVGTYDGTKYADTIAVVGNLAYLLDQEIGLLVVDITAPDNPVLVGTYETDGEFVST